MPTKDKDKEDQCSSSWKNLFLSAWATAKEKFWNTNKNYDSAAFDTPPESMEGELEAFDLAFETLLGDSHPFNSSNILGSYSRLPHCYQFESWDCGISCVLTVLRWLRPKKEYPQDSTLLAEERDERKVLIDNIGTKSVWTADLVLQIHRLFQNEDKANYLFCSKSMEVDRDYQDVGYYLAAFGNDQIRVNETFQELKRLEASTLCIPHLPLRCVLNAVCNENCVAIVLVDNFVLKCKKIINDGVDRYIGHYVILCGISRQKEHMEAADELEGMSGIKEDFCLVLCNPGQYDPPFLYVTLHRFEKAWRSKGTDDDIIFIADQQGNAR